MTSVVTSSRPAAGSGKKIGLLGGSFDPVHNAHIDLAIAAYKQLDLDEIQLIPARQPWQKAKLGAKPQQRLDMLTLACADHDFISINQIEINRSGPTYTIDTLELLDNTANYYWIMGSDQLVNFCSWHRWQDIIKFVTLAVAKRPATPIELPPELLQSMVRDIVEIPFNPLNISSTKIRQYLSTNKDCSAFINHKVLQYIFDNKIYSN